MDGVKGLYGIVALLMITSSYAATFQDVQERTNCLYRRTTTRREGNTYISETRTEIHFPGTKWKPSACEECSCSVYSYKNITACYLPMSDGPNVIDDPIEYVHYPESMFSYQINCCYPFKPLVSAKKDTEAQMFLTYGVVSAVSMSCDNFKQSVTSLPEGCIALTSEDGCSFTAVKENDHDQPCDGPISIVG